MKHYCDNILYYCPAKEKPNWVTGFCDRSGSFGLTIFKRYDRWYFKVTFEILLDIKDIALLETLQSFFGVGKIYSQKTTAVYRVTRYKDLLILIDHFKAYPLVSPKLLVFQLFTPFRGLEKQFY